MIRRLLCHVAPATRVVIAGWMLVVSLVAWPISSLTIFASGSASDQGILGLSWLALILTCVDIVVTADIRDQGVDGD